MIRRLFAIGVLAAVALVGAALASAGPQAVPTLKGTVGPGFTITLKRNGKTVKVLKHGTYKFVISDKSSIHSFTVEQTKGGKFEKALTTVPGMGSKTRILKLKAGKWKYYCPPHESSMFGFFTVK